jgi:hypothetical protein
MPKYGFLQYDAASNGESETDVSRHRGLRIFKFGIS